MSSASIGLTCGAGLQTHCSSRSISQSILLNFFGRGCLFVLLCTLSPTMLARLSWSVYNILRSCRPLEGIQCVTCASKLSSFLSQWIACCLSCHLALDEAKLTHLFEDADLDQDKSLSLAEWERLVKHPETGPHPLCFDANSDVLQLYTSVTFPSLWAEEIVHYLSTLEIDVHDARMLFQLLDDGDGHLSVQDRAQRRITYRSLLPVAEPGRGCHRLLSPCFQVAACIQPVQLPAMRFRRSLAGVLRRHSEGSRER